jgi:hypothetical protein
MDFASDVKCRLNHCGEKSPAHRIGRELNVIGRHDDCRVAVGDCGERSLAT